MNHYEKYLKYKSKYINLKLLLGGSNINDDFFTGECNNKELNYNGLTYKINFTDTTIYIYNNNNTMLLLEYDGNTIQIKLPPTNLNINKSVNKYTVNDLINILKKFIDIKNIESVEIENIAKLTFEKSNYTFKINSIIYRLFTKDNLDEISIYRKDKSTYKFQHNRILHSDITTLFENFKKKTFANFQKELINLLEKINKNKTCLELLKLYKEIRKNISDDEYNNSLVQIKLLNKQLNESDEIKDLYKTSFLNQVNILRCYTSEMIIRGISHGYCNEITNTIGSLIQNINSITFLIDFFEKNTEIEKTITKDNIELIESFINNINLLIKEPISYH